MNITACRPACRTRVRNAAFCVLRGGAPKLPGDAWSPEAMLTWMYERWMRRHEAATTDARRSILYAERLGFLRVVMRECRSDNEELRFAASQMTCTMSDISSEEESPNNGFSAVDMCSFG